jgi:agmatine deiminase
LLVGKEINHLELKNQSKLVMQETEYYYPAEWETHQAIWLSWPPSQDEFRLQQDKVVEVMKDMILALIPHVKIRLIVQVSRSINITNLFWKRLALKQNRSRTSLNRGDAIWIK